MANKFKMASRFAAAACYPTPGPLFHKETTVYYHETNVSLGLIFFLLCKYLIKILFRSWTLEMSQLTHHQEMAMQSPLFNYHFQMLQLIKSGAFLLTDMSRICKLSVEKVSPRLVMALKVKTILALILIQSLEDQCKYLNSTL